MQNQDSPEHVFAMRALEQLCQRERIQPNEQLQKLFWYGVLLGKRLSQSPVAERSNPEPESRQRDSSVSLDLSLSSPRTQIDGPHEPTTASEITELKNVGEFRL